MSKDKPENKRQQRKFMNNSIITRCCHSSQRRLSSSTFTVLDLSQGHNLKKTKVIEKHRNKNVEKRCFFWRCRLFILILLIDAFYGEIKETQKFILFSIKNFT